MDQLAIKNEIAGLRSLGQLMVQKAITLEKKLSPVQARAARKGPSIKVHAVVAKRIEKLNRKTKAI